VHPYPTVLPIRIGKEAPEYRGIQFALALEIAVESAVGEARTGPDLVHKGTLKAMQIEQLACTVKDASLPEEMGEQHKGDSRTHENIVLNIFRRDAPRRSG
jgi:hypothetical protein